jgi:hypothetical protein
MRILIAVILILAVCVFLFFQGITTKSHLREGHLGMFSYTTLLLMGGVVVVGYLFVLYAKAF